MKNIDELLGVAKLSELMSNDKKDESKKVLWVLAIIGAVAAVAGIAALVYKYLSPDYLEDIDDDYDDFDDDFFDEKDGSNIGKIVLLVCAILIFLAVIFYFITNFVINK